MSSSSRNGLLSSGQATPEVDSSADQVEDSSRIPFRQGSTSFELLRCASASDAVLAVSFTPYNSITPELAASAAQRGVPIVSLTDSAFSPLVPVSKAYLEVI